MPYNITYTWNLKYNSNGSSGGSWWVNDSACLCGGASLIASLEQWVEDLALLQLWRGLQLQLRFNLWSRK